MIIFCTKLHDVYDGIGNTASGDADFTIYMVYSAIDFLQGYIFSDDDRKRTHQVIQIYRFIGCI